MYRHQPRYVCYVMVAVLACFLEAQGETVYKTVNTDGSVNYSDQSSSGASPLVLPPLSVMPSTANSQNTQTPVTTPAVEKTVLYQQLDILSPHNQETIWNNSGEVSITLQISPNITPPDLLQLMIDGKVMGSSKESTAFVLKGLDRGTHLLQAQIINQHKKIVKVSPVVVFYIHKAIAAFTSPPSPPPTTPPPTTPAATIK